MTYGFGGSNSPRGTGSPGASSPGGTTSANSAGRYGGGGKSSLGGGTSASTAGRMGGSSSNTAGKSSASPSKGTTSANSAGRYGGGGASSIGGGSSGSTAGRYGGGGASSLGGASSASTAGRYGATPDNTARRTATDVNAIRGGGTTTANIGRYGGPISSGSTPANAGRYGGPTGNIASISGATTPTGFGPAVAGRYGGPLTSAPTGFAPHSNLPNARQAEIMGMSSLDAYNVGKALEDQKSYENYGLARESMLTAGITGLAGKFEMTKEFTDRVVNHIIGVESTNNPNAKNPNSTATGLGQILSKTWTHLVDTYAPDVVKGMTTAQKLGLRTDPVLSRQMTEAYTRENATTLQKAGIAVTPQSLYAAHFLGPQGAIASYKADPNASAKSVLGVRAVNANPSIMANKTIGSVLGYVNTKMAGTLDAPASGPVTTEARANKAAVAAREAVAAAAEAAGKDRQDPSVTRQGDVAAQQAYDAVKAGSPAPTQTAGTTPPAPAPPAAAQPAPAQPAPSQPTPNISLPQRAPKPTSRDAPPYQRSLTGTVLAGGIDVLSGFGGPVGLAGQIGSLLLGGDTLGGVIADAAGGKYGENYASPERNTPMRNLGSGNSGERLAEAAAARTGTSTVPKAEGGLGTTPAATFEEKYLGGSSAFDDTGRPTPEQKWDWRSAKYIGVANAPSI